MELQVRRVRNIEVFCRTRHTITSLCLFLVPSSLFIEFVVPNSPFEDTFNIDPIRITLFMSIGIRVCVLLS